MSKLNTNATVNVFVKLAEVVIELNSNANYNVSSAEEDMLLASKELISNKRLNRTHLKEMFKARRAYENLIDKKYSTDLTNDHKDPIKCFMRDTSAHLVEHNVPQRTRVALGLFDVAIGMINAPHMFTEKAA